MSNRIAIIGLTTGLGQAFARLASQSGAEVKALVEPGVLLDEGAAGALSAQEVGRHSDKSAIAAVAGAADVVVFAAALHLTAQSAQEALTAVVPLFEAAAAHRAHLVWLTPAVIFAATKQSSITAQSHAAPAGRMGSLFARAEILLEEEALTRRHSVTCLRMPPIYGPRDLDDALRAILTPAVEGRRARWPGPADARHELIHTEDAARAVLAALERPTAFARWQVPGAGALRGSELSDLLSAHAGHSGTQSAALTRGFAFAQGGASEARDERQEREWVYERPLRFEGGAFAAARGFRPAIDYGQGFFEVFRTLV